MIEAETKGALSWLAEVGTLVALAFAVAFLPIDVLSRVLVALLLLFGGLIRFLWVLARKRSKALSEAVDRYRSAEVSLLEVEGRAGLTDGMIALAYHLSQSPMSDPDHHYYEIDEMYRIDGDDATYQYRFRGTRVTPGSTTGLRIKLSGDTPADSKSLLAEARDVTGAALSVHFVRDDPYFKVAEIMFDHGVSTNDTFDVSVTFRWSGTFPRARSQDYAFSSWSDFATQGVDRIVSTLSSDVDIRAVRLFELSEGRRQLAPVQPKTIRDGGRWEVRWVAEHPTALSLLTFEKVLPS